MFIYVVLALSVATAIGMSPPMPGGIMDISETEEVRDAANFAADDINENSRVDAVNGQKWFTLTKINNPSHQVVNGHNYRMEIVLRQSECRNIDMNKGATILDCPPVADGMTRRCQVTVWHQAHGFGYKLTDQECTFD